MLVQHRRPDVDDAERIEAQEDPVLAQGAEEMRVGRGPLTELGLALGDGETAGRYGDGERISAGAAFLTPGAMAGGGQERWGADPEADLPAEAPTVPREFPIVRHSPSPSMLSCLRRGRIPSDGAQSS